VLESSKSISDKFKFVIIDDDDISIFIIKKLIQQFNKNIEVAGFKDARLAIKHYKDFGTAPNEIILLDLNMPIFSGWDFLEEFKKSNLVGNLFILSSTINMEDEEKSRSYNTVIGYISKPLNTQKIENILNVL
jgi:response regulator RpfG family c-di-GMP phosphodiesterase